ncbi:hypothetical protein MTBBW1_1720002 [Desulfamplus magnetovallimortis]|uniref:Uncharacterized protein n=1 Tax=Desulfamplus magnetovallimortis TaxID=1246637 RepID=A0A1W1H9U7_9BACT|nr:hypothetical protein MTBBW1_1720002 [Desulfamplus magnetovallimortis]
MELQSERVCCDVSSSIDLPRLDSVLPPRVELPLSVQKTLEEALSSLPGEMMCKESPPGNKYGGCELADILRLYWSDFQRNKNPVN